MEGPPLRSLALEPEVQVIAGRTEGTEPPTSVLWLHWLRADSTGIPQTGPIPLEIRVKMLVTLTPGLPLGGQNNTPHHVLQSRYTAGQGRVQTGQLTME